jgi:hypothetical protein
MQEIITAFPEQWHQVIGLLLSPITWIPRTHDVLMDFFLRSPSVWIAAAKYLLLLFPAVLGLTAIWCTQLSIYTLPFRTARLQFVSALLLTWWDAARAVWLYWMGLIRLVAALIGWLVLLAGFVVRTLTQGVRHLAMMPFMMSRMAERYFQPGVPWIAFVALLLWAVLEAIVLTHVLFPPITEILTDLAETQAAARFVGPTLFAFVFAFILGSFACAQALADAVRARQLRFLGQMIGIVIVVAFFQVMFLYREMVVTFTPWFAEYPAMTVVAATGSWLGVRALTWFLFGQYGTAPLLAFISRRPLTTPDARAYAASEAAAIAWWQPPLRDLKNEVEWLHAKSDRLLEYLALPVLHVLAAAVNFGMVLIASRPVFQLPFKHLEEIPETRTILTGLHLHPRKP